MNRNPERWMNGIIGPDTIKVGGAQISPARKSINLVGATQVDDPDNDQTNVTVNGGTKDVLVTRSCSFDAPDDSTNSHLDFYFDTLPVGARLVGAEILIVTPFDGGSLSAAAATMGSSSDAGIDTVMGAVSVIATHETPLSAPGSNPYFTRGDQDLFIRVALTGAVVDDLTDGEIIARIHYVTSS